MKCIPYRIGHADAECLTHALAAAIFGALGLPDIGQHFPPSDPQYKDMDSQLILAFACQQLTSNHYRLLNVDITLIAEAPKIGPHIPDIRQNLAHTLEIDSSQIGLKATTHEQLDAVGNKQGICAHAVCLVQHRDA